jgi:hypothetical protein
MKKPTIVRSVDAYGDRYWRVANAGPRTIARTEQIVYSLLAAGIEAHDELDRGRPAVHVSSPDVLSAVRRVLALPICRQCNLHHDGVCPDVWQPAFAFRQEGLV